MKILLFGGTGQIGHAIQTQAAAQKLTVTTAPREAYATPDTCFTKDYDAVINAAAYTDVDGAQEDQDNAFALNTDYPAILAKLCAERKIPFLHYSTDYVFDGQKEAPYNENDSPSPLNIYGQSKHNGEKAIQNSGAAYLIFRTSWVVSARRKNFLKTMVHLMQERETLRIVDDQIGAPNMAEDLATASLLALQNFNTDKSGLYHLSCDDYVSWYDFACAIHETMKEMGIPLTTQSLTPIPSTAYPTKALRPSNSRLDSGRFMRIFGHKIPSWRSRLAETIREIAYAP